MEQRKAYTILVFCVVFLLILLMFLINGFMGFLMLAAAIVAFCLLYKKYPWFISQFAKKKPTDASETASPFALHESGFTSHIVLINNNAMRLEQIDVDAPEFVIGRLPQCNYVIKGNPKVSREHAKIIFEEESGKSYLIDERSKYGTRLNGDELERGKRKQLHNGDIIQIDDCTFSVQTRNL